MDDRTWAKIAVQLGIINPGLAEEYEKTRRNLGLAKSLPEILKENGLINDKDIAEVAALEPVHLDGVPRSDHQRQSAAYARRCIAAKLIDEEQATECIRDLVIEGERRTMRELLIERRYAKPEQLDAMEKPPPPAAAPPAPAPAAGTKRRLRCPACKLTYEVVTRSGNAPACPRCKGTLVETSLAAGVRPDAAVDTARLRVAPIAKKAAPPPSPARPSFPCIICDHVFSAEADAGGRVRCPACGASFDRP